jgi:hypothetical protein
MMDKISAVRSSHAVFLLKRVVAMWATTRAVCLYQLFHGEFTVPSATATTSDDYYVRTRSLFLFFDNGALRIKSGTIVLI